MEYEIYTAYGVDELRIKVNEAILEGWEPLGGVAAAAESEDYNPVYAQAMIRKKK